MELWIRSQDKERLIKPIDFYIEETINYVNKCNEFNIYALNFANNDIIIGTYKTKERALEILDEIQDIIDFMICHKVMNYDVEQYMQFDYETLTKIQNKGLIYEMPKE